MPVCRPVSHQYDKRLIFGHLGIMEISPISVACSYIWWAVDHLNKED